MTDHANTPAAPIAPDNSAAPAAPVASGGWSSKDVATMHSDTQAMISKGQITLEAANKSFRDAGIVELLDPNAAARAPNGQFAPKPQELSPEAAQIDADFPPAKGPEFFHQPPADLSPQQQAEGTANVRGWLETARAPRDIGNSFINEAARVETAYKAMKPEQQELWARSEYTKLERIYGDELPAKFQLARQMLDEVEQRRPGLREYLCRSGIVDSAMAMSIIINHASRLAARLKN